MPIRMLREGILDSEAVNSLSPEAEVFYRRLMSVVDDFGRFDARSSVLRARLYPLKVASITEDQIVDWLIECDKTDLVTVYRVDGKPYLQLHRLGAPRAKLSKYPAPPEPACQSGCKHLKAAEIESKTQMIANESKCAQTPASAPYSYSYSDSDSFSYSGPTSDSEHGSEREQTPAEVGRSVGYDPLRESQENRKAFEAAWNAAGLRHLKRLSHALHARLDALLLIREWAETWRDALTRAGQIPFLASGTGRTQGPLDPSEFLRDDDFAASILRGKFDPRAGPGPKASPVIVVDPDPFATLARKHEAEGGVK